MTPDRGMPLFGFRDRLGPFSRVRDRIEANVLCLYPDGSRPTFIVTVDALYGGSIYPRLRERLGLLPEQLVVAGSHTHFAPGVDGSLPTLGQTLEDYVETVVGKLVEAIKGVKPLGKGYISYQVGAVGDLFINRRRQPFGLPISLPIVGGCISAPNRRGHLDSDLRVAVVTADSRPIAVLWGVSCHPVGSPEPRALSANFPGAVRSTIRDALDTDVPVLFLQGFSGDVRPNFVTRRPLKRLHPLAAYVLAGGMAFTEPSEREYSDWCHQLSLRALEAMDTCNSNSEELLGMSSSFTLPMPKPWVRYPTIQRLRLSQGLSLFGVNAEVVSERTTSLKSSCAGEQAFPVGCCNQVIGYWPTDSMRAEGGYEGGGAECYFPPVDWGAVGGPDRAWRSMVDGLMEASEDPLLSQDDAPSD